MNIIKVKIVGSDGKLKGRAYTYKSAIPVSVGDRVVADMAGTKKELEVVETGIPQSEIEGLNYEIKLIDGLAGTAEAEAVVPQESTKMVDIRILEESLPVISINYDEVKTGLAETLKKYQNAAVTEQTLQGYKSTQKELAGVRTKIDKYRKEKKKIYSAPIVEFENQCKELIAMVEAVEQPIKQGIALYDDKRRAAKRNEAEQVRLELLSESGLNEKYAAMLQIKDIYCNLTANKTTIKNDMKAEIETLIEKQKAEEMKEAAVLASIDAQNERLKRKLVLEDFRYILSADLLTIIREIQLKADVIYEAENPKEPEPAIEIKTEEPEPEKESEPAEQVVKQAVYSVRLQGNIDDIKHIIGLAKAKGLDVEVTGKMEL